MAAIQARPRDKARSYTHGSDSRNSSPHQYTNNSSLFSRLMHSYRCECHHWSSSSPEIDYHEFHWNPKLWGHFERANKNNKRWRNCRSAGSWRRIVRKYLSVPIHESRRIRLTPRVLREHSLEIIKAVVEWSNAEWSDHHDTVAWSNNSLALPVCKNM